MASWISCTIILDLFILQAFILPGYSRKYRSVPFRPSGPNELHNGGQLDEHPSAGNPDFIWYTQTVAAGDTAVLHCSFDAIFAQLRNGNIDWAREPSMKTGTEAEVEADAGEPVMLASGKKVEVEDRRVRVYRPHNSALSVLIIRRVKKRDAGLYRCNLAGSSTRYKYMILNVTESTIEAKTSPPKLRTRVGRDVTLWCNASGYPQPVVYWTREDRNRKLQDGNNQYWGNGLQFQTPTEQDTGIYACYLDNFVQPVVSYRFSLFVEDSPWDIGGFKMRFDSTQWYEHDDLDPIPVQGMSYLLMCETRGTPKPLPKIRWFRDGKPIKNTRHFYIIEDRPEWRTGYTSSTLVLMRFVPRFQGNYTCEATNIFRTRRELFHITGFLEKAPATANTHLAGFPLGGRGKNHPLSGIKIDIPHLEGDHGDPDETYEEDDDEEDRDQPAVEEVEDEAEQLWKEEEEEDAAMEKALREGFGKDGDEEEEDANDEEENGDDSAPEGITDDEDFEEVSGWGGDAETPGDGGGDRD